MTALAPAVAAIRGAVTACLRRWPEDDVLVACSGGADSMALAAAAGFVAPRLGRRCALASIDHQLQPGSAGRAQRVADWAAGQGLHPVFVRSVTVDGVGGPEAAARTARYAALTDLAVQSGHMTVLLGHTRDDQAETVLLAMLRGAGLRGLAAMPQRRAVGSVSLVRPLLDITRAQTRAACEALGLQVWDDPHNVADRYARSRTRSLLVSLVDTLGEAVVGNLARTAALAAADAELLDALAEQAAARVRTANGALRVPELADLPSALRTRVLHSWALAHGVGGTALGYVHVLAMQALVTDWHGQGPVYLPGAFTVVRRRDELTIAGPWLVPEGGGASSVDMAG